jgi:hypothetical protein
MSRWDGLQGIRFGLWRIVHRHRWIPHRFQPAWQLCAHPACTDSRAVRNPESAFCDCGRMADVVHTPEDCKDLEVGTHE